MSLKPIIATPPDSDAWLLSPEDAARPFSLIVQQRQLISVFPYIRLVWAEGSDNKIEICFATHTVAVSGHGLTILLTALAEHRIVRLVEPSANEAKFRNVGPTITSISIRVPEKEEAE
jgi:hypothetical protein